MTTFVRTAYHQQKMLELGKEITHLRQRVAELDAILGKRPCQYNRCIQYAEAIKDAERYRWLKAQHNDWESSWRVYQPHPTLGSVAIDQGLTADLDNVIDAAMADPDDDFTRGEHDL